MINSRNSLDCFKPKKMIADDGVPEKFAQAQLRVKLQRVKKENDGPYLIFHQVRGTAIRIVQQGLTRLIVRGKQPQSTNSKEVKHLLFKFIFAFVLLKTILVIRVKTFLLENRFMLHQLLAL